MLEYVTDNSSAKRHYVAIVYTALRACARVQSAEQRARAWQWRGEARCATCLLALGATFATFLCTVQNALLAYAKQADIVACSEPQPRLAAAAQQTPLLPVGDAPVRVTAHAI